MSYTPPSIGPSGLTIPTYQDILQDNLQAFLNIFGVNQYIAPDSAIYQLLAIISLKQSDTNLAAQFAYNQSSPQTAVGAGLDRVVKMNGLARAAYTFSTAVLTVSGVAGTTINNGFAQDVNGNLWALPSPTVIPSGGSINVTATCTTPGNVTAEPGQISIRSSPVVGWNSVTNSAAATPGTPVESDSELRARQAISVALPALTPIASTQAAVLAVPGVIRVAPPYPTPSAPGSSIENPTGATDSWGNPAHSISIVAQGGTDLAVATAIYSKKTIGCLSNGTTSIAVTDPVTGNVETISFYRPTFTPIMVQVQIHGYFGTLTSAVLALIQTTVANYLNALSIGETVSLGELYYEIQALNTTPPTQPGFGIQSLTIGKQAAATTGSITIGTNSLTVASGTGTANGQTVMGPGIPYGTTITSGGGTTTLTLSNNATATEVTQPYTFGTLAAGDVAMTNFFYVASGATTNVTVATV